MLTIRAASFLPLTLPHPQHFTRLQPVQGERGTLFKCPHNAPSTGNVSCTSPLEYPARKRQNSYKRKIDQGNHIHCNSLPNRPGFRLQNNHLMISQLKKKKKSN